MVLGRAQRVGIRVADVGGRGQPGEQRRERGATLEGVVHAGPLRPHARENLRRRSEDGVRRVSDLHRSRAGSAYLSMYRTDTSERRSPCPSVHPLVASPSAGDPPVSKRTDVLELAVLGLLHESPLHGYELRKRLNTLLGNFRAFSYGSLYPCLKGLLAQGLITEERSTGRCDQPSIQDRLQADGRRQGALPGAAGPVRSAVLGGRELRGALRVLRPDRAEVRMRILEGRRSRLEERLDNVRRPSRAPASGWTATPSSCSSTVWRASSARCDG